MSYSIKVGITEFIIEEDSLSIRKSKAQTVRHYPGTDISDTVDQGRRATIISCTIVARNDTERIQAEQILHGNEESTFEYHNFYYKKVTPGESAQPTPILPNRNMWRIRAEFIAKDPLPYSVATDDPLY